MPLGVFFVIHDEIKGPEIKGSYFRDSIELPQEFISKLYMSHAGFSSTSNLEIKFDRYRSVSRFTGHLDRKTGKEGIMGILFDQNEKFENLEFFLQRNLTYAVHNPANKTMEDIFSNKLLHYLKLVKIFNLVKIEKIPEIFIIHGEKKFNSLSLKISERNVPNEEISELYNKIIKNQEITPYQSILLNSDGRNLTYFVVKFDKINSETENIILTLEPYLKKFYDYVVELIILFFLASEINVIPLKQKLFKTYSNKKKSLLQLLGTASNYQEKFNEIISLIINGDIYLTPLL